MVALYKKLQLLSSLPDNDNYLLEKKIKLYKLSSWKTRIALSKLNWG